MMNKVVQIPSITDQIQEVMTADIDDFIEDQDPLSQIVDDVIKRYSVLPFKTNPIGAKRNIYIDKLFTKSWINYVNPMFPDEAMMYYWLDYTTAIQMNQGEAKEYIEKESGKFIA